MDQKTSNPDQNIAETEKKLEARLLDAIKRIEMGRDDALAQLGERRSDLEKASAEVAGEIEQMAEQADAELKNLQKRLGELNYALAESDGIEDIENLDRLQARIGEAMTETLEELARLEAKGMKAGGAGSRIERAWWEFAAALELARTHLADAASEGSVDFERDRRKLVDHLRELQASADDPELVKQRLKKLEDMYAQFKHITKALMMDPEEASPRVEKEARRASR